MFPGAGVGGQSDLAWAVSTVLLSIFAAGVGMFFLTKYTRSIPIANRLVLFDRQPATDVSGAHTGLLAAMADPRVPAPVRGISVGDTGVSHSRLNPSGTAEINERLVDVVSEFGYVDAGSPIRVVNITEYRIGVEPIRQGTTPGHAGAPEDRA
jgi:membrane-bound serine protease (ClpP class)